MSEFSRGNLPEVTEEGFYAGTPVVARETDLLGSERGTYVRLAVEGKADDRPTSRGPIYDSLVPGRTGTIDVPEPTSTE